MFKRIEATDEWRRAPTHRVRSRTGGLFALFAIGLAVTCVAIAAGVGVDDGGVLALVIILGACGVGAAVGALYFYMAGSSRIAR